MRKRIFARLFSLPKIIRHYFLYDRKLLADFSRCAWEAIRTFLENAVSRPGRGAAIIATQTFGDFPDRFHPHLHVLCADGVFTDDGAFVPAPDIECDKLTGLFRHKVLKMLLAKGKITRERIRMMDGWSLFRRSAVISRTLPWFAPNSAKTYAPLHRDNHRHPFCSHNMWYRQYP